MTKGVIRNYPDPFTASWEITDTVHVSANLRLVASDAQSREVVGLFSGRESANLHNISRAVKGQPSESYVHRLESLTRPMTQVRKMLCGLKVRFAIRQAGIRLSSYRSRLGRNTN